MSASRPYVPSLGPCHVRSPLATTQFVSDDARVLNEIELPRRRGLREPRFFEVAGPRERLFFEPRSVRAAIVTAGGVCPGINDVVRAIVLELRHRYGVESIHGYRYGFGGVGAPSIPLDLETVKTVHMRGGTFLGTARALVPPAAIVDALVRDGADMLFAVGGDGTMHAAHAIAGEIRQRGLSIAIVGVPKTIDNDIPFVDKTFGFDTAVATARLVLEAAHAEASSAPRGVALVKLMGRNAGFIAAHATLASHDVNACLVPEVPFDLGVFLDWLDARLDRRGHAVVVVAEGCRLDDGHASDERDVGRQLKRAIEARAPLTLKYIDPSYVVRALRATAEDAVFCDALGRNAVHAAMAGKTDLLVGRWHRRFTHVSLADVLAREKRLDPTGAVWHQVLESTGQPSFVREDQRASFATSR
jgi:6-phosphofructokinase 1